MINPQFYIYKNWRARGYRVRIHKGSCPFCKNGLGRSNGDYNPLNGNWNGPFQTLEIARAKASTLLGGIQADTCRFCFRR